MDALDRAIELLAPLPAQARLEAAATRLGGGGGGPLAAVPVGSERAPSPSCIDGRLLEAVAAAALDGRAGAHFTPGPEARLLAAFGLARVAARRGVDEERAVGALLEGRADAALARALDGVRVLDPCCGGGALLAAAHLLGAAAGFRPRLLGCDVAPLAAAACRARLALLSADAAVHAADALSEPWPPADLVLTNPPFVRHEALAPAAKARAVARSGLSRQADLSAHLAAIALAHAPDVALVWPRGLDGARSAAPLRARAAADGGFTVRLRSRTGATFGASVDAALVAWSRGAASRAIVEVDRPLGALRPAEAAALACGRDPGARRGELALPEAQPLGEVCAVRFGVKTGCNGFFHLRPLGGERFLSTLLGEVRLPPAALQPVLASLREARSPREAAPGRLLFRPPGPVALDRRVRAYLEAGERAGVAARPTCASRDPWWLVVPRRAPAPVLHPAKVSARAFAFENARGYWEDKKWQALFPREGLEPWLVAAVLSATPVRLAVDRAARQLTGAQAIADVDCHVLAAAPFPLEAALPRLRAAAAAPWRALAGDPVSTDLPAMLARPAQEALDLAVGAALGLSPGAVREARAALRQHVADRLALAVQVRAAVEAVRAPRGAK